MLRTRVGYCVLGTTVGYCVLGTTVGYCVLGTTVGYCVLDTTVALRAPHDDAPAAPGSFLPISCSQHAERVNDQRYLPNSALWGQRVGPPRCHSDVAERLPSLNLGVRASWLDEGRSVGPSRFATPGFATPGFAVGSSARGSMRLAIR